jgi:hypothetical protein
MGDVDVYVVLSVLGWIATICRAIGMFVKNEIAIKCWTTAGNVGWLIVGIIQWQVLDMSMTLFVSNIICVAVFLYSMSQMKKNRRFNQIKE